MKTTTATKPYTVYLHGSKGFCRRHESFDDPAAAVDSCAELNRAEKGNNAGWFYRTNVFEVLASAAAERALPIVAEQVAAGWSATRGEDGEAAMIWLENEESGDTYALRIGVAEIDLDRHRRGDAHFTLPLEAVSEASVGAIVKAAVALTVDAD